MKKTNKKSNKNKANKRQDEVMVISKNVNPHFKTVWQSDKPYNILRGGRNSTKSSVIAMKLVLMATLLADKDIKANIVCIRKVGRTIKDSMLPQIKWAMEKLGVLGEWEERASPIQLINKSTGGMFKFYGQDDFAKLKSNAIGNIFAVWYEESAEFKNAEEFDQTNITFMRQKLEGYKYVQIYWSYNPPKNPYHWINEWCDKKAKDEMYLVHKSSYLDDVLGVALTEQTRKTIEKMKETDYDYYRYLYLGEPVGLGTNVYKIELFQRADSVEDILENGEFIVYLYFGTDTGFQRSATTCGCVGLTNKGKIIVLDCYYYSPLGKTEKKAPSDLAPEIREFELEMTKKYGRTSGSRRNHTVDSADGGVRTEYYKLYKERLHPVAKKTKLVMTEKVQNYLAQGRVYVVNTENNVKYFIEEHKRYQWEEGAEYQKNPSVVKDEDHTCDWFQYIITDNEKDLGS